MKYFGNPYEPVKSTRNGKIALYSTLRPAKRRKKTPTYEYQCEQCGFQFERFQKISEEPLKKCPECDGKVRRLIGAGSGIIFKGSGFYATDYGSGSKGSSCERERPCCGRDTPCEKSPRNSK